MTETTNTTTSYACARDSTGSCILLNLTCTNNQRIQIMEAKYGYLQQSLQSCSGNGNGWKCGGESGSCCAPNNSDLEPYSTSHQYDLFNRCSWKQNCSSRVAVYNTSDVYSAVSFDCISGTVFI